MPIGKPRRFRIAVGIAALAAIVPASVAVGAQSASRSVESTGTVSTASTYDPAGILGGAPIRGMILADYGNPTQSSIADLPRFKADGVNTIVVYINVHTPTPNSTYIEPTSSDLSDYRLVKLTNAAHALGMAVEFSPVLVIDYPDKVWRGYISPTSVTAWFHDYDVMITHYVNLADALGVEIFSIGSELSAMQNQAGHWAALARWMHTHFSGITTYMATGNSVFSISWLSSLDIIGLSPYYSLSNWSNPDPPVSQLVYTWKTAYLPRLAALSAKTHRQLFFAEIGYCSVVGATIHPAHGYRDGTAVSQDAQATAYQALFQATSGARWLRGTAWWQWDDIVNPLTDHGFAMRDKKAECVLAHYWNAQSPSLGPPVDTTPGACLANHLQTQL